MRTPDVATELFAHNVFAMQVSIFSGKIALIDYIALYSEIPNWFISILDMGSDFSGISIHR